MNCRKNLPTETFQVGSLSFQEKKTIILNDYVNIHLVIFYINISLTLHLQYGIMV